MKFHSSDYITGAVDLDLHNSKAMEPAATAWFNKGETGEVKCRYVLKASLGNITTGSLETGFDTHLWICIRN